MLKTRSFTLAAVITLAFGAPALAEDYAVVQIPTLEGWPSLLAQDMNDHGHATGVGFAGFASMDRAFYFDGENTHDFTQALIDTVPPDYFFVGTSALSINNLNHILFNLVVVDLGVFPYIWDGENYIEVDPDIPPGAEPGGSALNNLGQVAGTYKQEYFDGSQWHLIHRAFIWDRHAGTTVIIDPPAPYTSSGARDISDTGYVTGTLTGGPEPARGYIWKDGVMTLFEGVDADDYVSFSQRINDAGHAGAFTTNQPDPGQPSLSRVFHWSAQGVHHWSYPTGNLTGFDVRGMNNNNEIVGTMYGPQQAFHFHNGVVRNLNNHTTSPVPGTTLDLWEAAAVNAKSQILAEGQMIGTGDWNNYTFILTPKDYGPLGDLNGDGVVDVSDLLILLAAWGDCPRSGDCPADLNGDGVVDVSDLLILLSNWG